MCEACEVMIENSNQVDADRKRIVEAIRKMQTSGGSNFISGNQLIDIVYNQQREDNINIYKGWD